jgi:hypothetical protein
MRAGKVGRCRGWRPSRGRRGRHGRSEGSHRKSGERPADRWGPPAPSVPARGRVRRAPAACRAGRETALPRCSAVRGGRSSASASISVSDSAAGRPLTGCARNRRASTSGLGRAPEVRGQPGDRPGQEAHRIKFHRVDGQDLELRARGRSRDIGMGPRDGVRQPVRREGLGQVGQGGRHRSRPGPAPARPRHGPTQKDARQAGPSHGQGPPAPSRSDARAA